MKSLSWNASRLLLLLSLVLSVNSLNVQPASNFNYMSDASRCLAQLREKFGLITPITRTLYGIVGIGYDTLQSRQANPIFAPSFKQCQTTPDGQYLLPDNVLAVPIQKTKLDRLATYYSNFSEVSNSKQRTWGLKGNLAVDGIGIDASFSHEYQDTKVSMYQYESSMMVTSLTYEAYIIVASPASSLTDDFKARIREVAEAMKCKLVYKVRYLTQAIVRDYGTHVLLKSTTGAIIQQEIYIDSYTEGHNSSSLSGLRAAAGFNFLGEIAVGAQADTSRKVTDDDKEYLSTKTNHAVLRSTGGTSVERLIGGDPSAKNSFAVDNIVGFDNEGTPLSSLITTANFPEFDHSFIVNLRKTLDEATGTFYDQNTIRGCMDRSAINWNFKANVDDGSCKPDPQRYPINGMFQTCTPMPEAYGSSSEQSQDDPTQCADDNDDNPNNCAHMTPPERCEGLEQPNLFTGDFSCPQDYYPVQIFSRAHQFPDRTEEQNQTICERKFIKKKCKTNYWRVIYKDVVNLTSYYCAAKNLSQLHDQEGTMFGGLYKEGENNVYTNAPGCPGTYQKYPLAADTFVCMSMDYEADSKYAIPINGFFSCQTPENQRKCSDGFSQHLATVVGNCSIYYCVRPHVFQALIPPQIKMPPYIDSAYAETDTPISELKVFMNGSLALQIPIIKVVNAIIPKTPKNPGKINNNLGKPIFTYDQVVAALAHFRGNTWSVLNQIAAADYNDIYSNYLNNFSEDDADMDYNSAKDIFAHYNDTITPFVHDL